MMFTAVLELKDLVFNPVSVLPVIPICVAVKLHLGFSDQIVKICQHTCSLSSLISLTINQRLLAYTLHFQPPSKCVILHIEGNIFPFSLVCPS